MNKLLANVMAGMLVVIGVVGAVIGGGITYKFFAEELLVVLAVGAVSSLAMPILALVFITNVGSWLTEPEAQSKSSKRSKGGR